MPRYGDGPNRKGEHGEGSAARKAGHEKAGPAANDGTHEKGVLPAGSPFIKPIQPPGSSGGIGELPAQGRVGKARGARPGRQVDKFLPGLGAGSSLVPGGFVDHSEIPGPSAFIIDAEALARMRNATGFKAGGFGAVGEAARAKGETQVSFRRRRLAIEISESTGRRQRVITATERLSHLPIFVPSKALVNIDLGPHGLAEHLGPKGSFEAMVRDADVYFLEHANWSSGIDQEFNRIARGDVRTYQRVRQTLLAMGEQGEFTRRVIDGLYNSGTIVGFLDVSDDDPRNADIHKLMPTGSEEQVGTRLQVHSGPVEIDELVDAWSASVQDWVIGNNYRESLMVSRIGPKIQELLDTNPKLKRKNEIKVLMRLGTLHSSVGTQLLDAGVESSRVTAQTRLGTPVLTIRQWYIRENMQGRRLGPEEEKRLCLRSLYEGLTTPLIEDSFSSQWERLGYYERRRAQLRVSSQLTNDELMAITGEGPSISREEREAAASKAFGLIGRYVVRQRLE